MPPPGFMHQRRLAVSEELAVGSNSFPPTVAGGPDKGVPAEEPSNCCTRCINNWRSGSCRVSSCKRASTWASSVRLAGKETRYGLLMARLTGTRYRNSKITDPRLELSNASHFDTVGERIRPFVAASRA